MNVLSFFRYITERFPHLSFPQEKCCSETPLELFLISRYLSSPATPIFSVSLAELGIMTFSLCLEAYPELGNLKIVPDTPSLLTKFLGRV